MTKSLQTAGSIWIPSVVLADLARSADTFAPLETGGVLLGYWVHAPSGTTCEAEAVVTAQIGPGPRAVHRERSFSPDHVYQEEEIARLYHESGRRWNYIGDWHTHPSGPGSLSGRDKATLRRIATTPAARAPFPVMIVLASGAPWVPCAWLAMTSRHRWWSRKPLEVTALRLREYDS